MTVRGRIPGRVGLWEVDLADDLIEMISCLDPGTLIDELVKADRLLRARGIHLEEPYMSSAL